MKICSGKSVLEGIAIGKIYLFCKQEYTLERKEIQNTAEETGRFERAAVAAKEQLEKLHQAAREKTGERQAEIFQVHHLMLEDKDYLDAVHDMILKEKVCAEYAVYAAGKQFSEQFGQMEDAYMKERAADVLDISDRVIRILCGIPELGIETKEPVILAADDLSPSQTVQLDKSRILALVTKKGSANSHTAILARSMNIPALVQTKLELSECRQGQQAVVDAFSGQLILDPDEETLERMREKKKNYDQKQAQLRELVGKENVTRDGRHIDIYANIGSPADVDSVLEADAGGIGLFRSEFLYLGRKSAPSEEEQFKSYKEVIERMNPKKVIIRTLDIGADKQVPYFDLPEEENPAMGYRAIRICLEQEALFKTQLRAILRAAVYGNVGIMLPMVISAEEIRRSKEILEEVKKELNAEKIVFGKAELGIMIETPAAVMISSELAKEVDFFSIGTNDLTQYTLAIDRQNPRLDPFYDAHHPAVLRMISMTVENAHKNGIWVGICGELAADLSLTKEFVEMGVDELSVSPTYVLGLRRKIREL